MHSAMHFVIWQLLAAVSSAFILQVASIEPSAHSWHFGAAIVPFSMPHAVNSSQQFVPRHVPQGSFIPEVAKPLMQIAV